jgi:HEPN domain-containing protein
MTAHIEEARRLLRLARRDEAAFQALMRASEVAAEVALFHAQQASEKALKAVMCLQQIEFRRIHDLEELAGQLADAGCRPPVDVDMLRRLTPYAVEYRYEDEAPSLLTVEQAVLFVSALLNWVDSRLASCRQNPQ